MSGNHIAAYADIPAVLLVVPVDAYRVSLIERARGKCQSRLRRAEDVFEVDVSRVIKVVTVTLHAAEYIAVLVVGKLGTTLHK
jgi:hypothetical protein